MSTCKLFAKIINRIIQEATHHDIYPYLFQVARLPMEILRKYQQQISADNNKVADLILAAFVLGYDDVLPEIINRIDSKTLVACIHIVSYLSFTHNIIYPAIWAYTAGSKLETERIFMTFFRQWLAILIETNQIDILNKMYDGNLTRKLKDLDDFQLLSSDTHESTYRYCTNILIENYIKKALFNGERDIFHLADKWHDGISNYIRSIFNQHLIYVLYGGHLKLFVQWTKFEYKLVSRYYKLIICGLLRCNHVDQCQSFLSTITSNLVHSEIIQNIELSDIMIDLSTDPIIVPLISLSTFEFCIKKFKFDVKSRPNNVQIQNFYPNILSSNICAKYIINSGNNNIITNE